MNINSTIISGLAGILISFIINFIFIYKYKKSAFFISTILFIFVLIQTIGMQIYSSNGPVEESIRVYLIDNGIQYIFWLFMFIVSFIMGFIKEYKNLNGKLLEVFKKNIFNFIICMISIIAFYPILIYIIKNFLKKYF